MAGAAQRSPKLPVQQLATVVDTLGSEGFSDAFLSLMAEAAGADMCSAFAVEPSGQLRCIFSAGAHPDIPGFARLASQRYAMSYWRRDMVTRHALLQAGPGKRVRVARQAGNSIVDPEYRRVCYEAGAVAERLTIYRNTPRAIFASVYRTRKSGPFSASEISDVEALGDIAIALVLRHDEMVLRGERRGISTSVDDISTCLLGSGRSLSLREAEVCAWLVNGESQADIAVRTRLSLATIVTYRRRAYAKLLVANRRQLKAFYETTASS